MNNSIILLGEGMEYLLKGKEEKGVHKVKVKRFANKEIYVQIPVTVREKDVFYIKTCFNNPTESIMEILIACDALKRASTKSITVVVPHLAYSRQDRKVECREPISARLTANLLECAGATRLVTFDMHCDQIQGFYSIPCDNLPGQHLLIKEVKKFLTSNSVIVSPDIGGVKRANSWARALDLPLVIVDKRRPAHNENVVSHIVGDVEGKDLILVDDMLDTGGTILAAAKSFKERGAKSIMVVVTHPIFSKGISYWTENSSDISKVVALETIPQELPKNTNIDLVPIWNPLKIVISKIADGFTLMQPFAIWEVTS